MRYTILRRVWAGLVLMFSAGLAATLATIFRARLFEHAVACGGLLLYAALVRSQFRRRRENDWWFPAVLKMGARGRSSAEPRNDLPKVGDELLYSPTLVAAARNSWFDELSAIAVGVVACVGLLERPLVGPVLPVGDAAWIGGLAVLSVVGAFFASLTSYVVGTGAVDRERKAIMHARAAGACRVLRKLAVLVPATGLRDKGGAFDELLQGDRGYRGQAWATLHIDGFDIRVAWIQGWSPTWPTDYRPRPDVEFGAFVGTVRRGHAFNVSFSVSPDLRVSLLEVKDTDYDEAIHEHIKRHLRGGEPAAMPTPAQWVEELKSAVIAHEERLTRGNCARAKGLAHCLIRDRMDLSSDPRLRIQLSKGDPVPTPDGPESPSEVVVSFEGVVVLRAMLLQGVTVLQELEVDGAWTVALERALALAQEPASHTSGRAKDSLIDAIRQARSRYDFLQADRLLRELRDAYGATNAGAACERLAEGLSAAIEGAEAGAPAMLEELRKLNEVEFSPFATRSSWEAAPFWTTRMQALDAAIAQADSGSRRKLLLARERAARDFEIEKLREQLRAPLARDVRLRSFAPARAPYIRALEAQAMRAFNADDELEPVLEELHRQGSLDGICRQMAERARQVQRVPWCVRSSGVLRVVLEEGNAVRAETKQMLRATLDLARMQELSEILSREPPAPLDADEEASELEVRLRQLERDRHLDRFREAAENGDLWGLPRLPLILENWRKLAAFDEVQEAVVAGVEDDGRLLSFLVGYLAVHDEHDVDAGKDLEALVDVELLKVRLQDIVRRDSALRDRAGRVLGQLDVWLEARTRP